MPSGTSALQLCCVAVDCWPPLAWLARCERASGVVRVFHGTGLETGSDWFGEIVWAGGAGGAGAAGAAGGAYATADFDRTDVVFGSGGRLRDGRLVFVSAGSTLDRLHSLEDSVGVWVSNSLVCLLRARGATVDPAYPRYYKDFRTIRLGLGRYRRVMPTSAGPLRLTYFDNLVWDGACLREAAKPSPRRDFGSFSRYRDFLAGALADLAANAAAPGRTRPYRLVGTISSGYDSPTAVTLARPYLDTVVSFDRGRDGAADAGAALGAALGLAPVVVRSDQWRAAPFAEVPFLAGDAKGEDVYFKGSEPLFGGAVVLTGFHGDKVWDPDAHLTGHDFHRADQSGVSLTEYRLWAGFIHCPVPFIGGRQIRDIRSISRSPELAPWDVGRATRYTRPICRRIVEEAGACRESFGRHKTSPSVLFFDDRQSFLSPASFADYVSWLERHGLAPLPTASRGLARRTALSVADVLDALARRAGLAPGTRFPSRAAGWLRARARRQPLFRHLFPWALERAAARYAPLEPAARTPAAGSSLIASGSATH
jgi:hypothetical protein